MERHHNLKLYTCDICAKAGLSEEEMRTHMLLEHIEVDVICPFCDLSGITTEEMSLHVNSVHLDSENDAEPKSKVVNQNTNYQPTGVQKTKPNNNNNSITSFKNNTLKIYTGSQEKTTKPVNKRKKICSDDITTNTRSVINSDIEMDSSLNLSSSLFSDDSPVAENLEKAEINLKVDEKINPTKLYLNSSRSNSETMHSEGDSKKDSRLGSNIFQEAQFSKIKCDQEQNKNNSQLQKSSLDAMETEFGCPLCSFYTDCGETLNIHVNQAHLQDTPQKLTERHDRVVNSVIPGGNSEQTHVRNIDLNHYETDSAKYKETEITVNREVTECGKQGEEVGVTESSCSGAGISSSVIDTNSSMCGYEEGYTPLKREPTTEGPQLCPYCDLEIEEEISLKFHINGNHAEEEVNKNEQADVLECPLCGEIFGFGSEEEQLLQAHVDSHFTSQAQVMVQADASQSAISMTDSQMAQELQRREDQARKYQLEKKQNPVKTKTSPNTHNKENRSYKQTAVKNLEKAVSKGQMSITDFYNQKQNILQANRTGVDEGISSTKDIILRLDQYYRQLTHSQISHHWLASPLDHYSGSYGDRGWGCGYRNLQMLLSSLAKIPIYQKSLFNGTLKIPSIPKLQQLIEDAWGKGFDPQGKEQLKTLLNTRKWIGATEIYATLSSLNVKCELVDFYMATGKDSTHPRLFQWVRDYFRSGQVYKPPLYLQHQGHSRTIVGIEEYKDGSLKLLIFDPGTAKGQMMKFLRGNIDNNLMKTVRRTLYGLKAKQYQIVAVSGVLSPYEQEESKLLRSERIP